jgi:Protein O-mannosyl-transferase TMEM260-like
MGRAERARKEGRKPAAAPASPGPPWAEPAPRALRLSAGFVLAAALAAYGLTLAPTVTLVDSGELIAAARNLGVAHPPGFPSYVLLGHLASRVPAGSVAERLNAFSAVGAALAAAALVLAVGHGLRTGDAPVGGRSRTAAAPATLAGLLLAFGHTLWSYATVTEVYALTTLALVALLGLALAARRSEGRAPWFALAAVLGLATGTHHVTIALLLPSLAVLAWRPLRRRGSVPFAAALLATVAAAAAVVYLYLPWAAARGAFPSWGDPRTLERFWWHLSGRQYQAFLTPSAESVRVEAAAFVRALFREFGPPWFPAALALSAYGFVRLFRHDRALFVASALLFGLDAVYALSYTIAEDKDAYYLPAVVALALAAGVGAAALLARVTRKRPLWAAALFAIPLVALLHHRTALDRSRFWIAHDYARDALAGVSTDGLLLTADWQLYSPLLYFQEVEGWRKDVMAVDVSLLRRSWYVEALRARHPTRWEPLRRETDAFLEDLRAWERDPALYERDVSRNRRINDRFQAMVVALVTHAPRAFATNEVVIAASSPDPSLAQRLTAALSLTPRGLTFALGPPDDAPAPELRPRGLFDGTLRLEASDVARTKVAPAYLGMTLNRGRYLQSRGDRAGAEVAYQQALAWDPSYAPARAALVGLGR